MTITHASSTLTGPRIHSPLATTAGLQRHRQSDRSQHQRLACLVTLPPSAQLPHAREALLLAEWVARGTLSPRRGGASIEGGLGLEACGLVVVSVVERAC